MFSEWFHKGGLIMWPLMLCSIIGMAIIFDRCWALLRSSLDFHKFIESLTVHLRSTHAREVPRCLKDRPASASIVARLYYKYLGENVAKRNEALKREGVRHLENLGHRLKMLAAIAQVAPLLGLLGTVTGLVVAFYQIEALGGRVQPTDLAGGIWEALLTTVVGLSIGIPCLLAHQFIQAQIDRRAHEMTETVSELDEVFAHSNDNQSVTEHTEFSA